MIEQTKWLKVKSEVYQNELDKMVAQITLEDDANIESIHKEIEKAKYDAEEEGDVSGTNSKAVRVVCLFLSAKVAKL